MKNYVDIPKERPQGPPAPPALKNDKSCTWLNNEDYGFMSQCDNSFFNDGTIDWMDYCPFCGGKVIEQGKD